MSTQDENKQLVRRYLTEAWDNGNVAILDELLASDFASHGGPPGAPSDRNAEKAMVQSFLNAFGGFKSTIEDQVAEGDRVATRWSAVGKHQGVFAGVPPTGRNVFMTGTEIARVRDGKITDIWVSFDMFGLLQQLGAIPTPSVPRGGSLER